MRFKTAALLLAAISFISPLQALGQQWHENPEIAEYFKAEKTKGTFVLYDPDTHQFTGYNETRAKKRYVPASTFKIPNSVIGLSVGAVRDVDELLPYGGKPQPMKSWEKNMGLRQAIKLSNVPVYQALARRIGLERMRAEIRRMGYGNADIGTVVDRFWLDGPLRISAVEQVLFLSALSQNKLPQDKEAQAQVREIMLVESGSDWAIYAKTGLSLQTKPGIGWWVGWVEKAGKIYPFAINIDINHVKQDTEKRVKLGRDCLKLLHILD